MKQRVTISLSKGLLERIDRDREIASRSAFIERELLRALESQDVGACPGECRCR